MEQSQNTFTEGLNKDLNPIATPNNVLTDALNATLITFNGNELMLLNDMGNTNLTYYPRTWESIEDETTGDVDYRSVTSKISEKVKLSDGFIPIGVKEHGDIIYIVSYNPKTKESEIGSFPGPEYKPFSIEILKKFTPNNISVKTLNDLKKIYKLTTFDNSDDKNAFIKFRDLLNINYLVCSKLNNVEFPSNLISSNLTNNRKLLKLKFINLEKNEDISLYIDFKPDQKKLKFFYPNVSKGNIGIKFELEDIDDFYTFEYPEVEIKENNSGDKHITIKLQKLYIKQLAEFLKVNEIKWSFKIEHYNETISIKKEGTINLEENKEEIILDLSKSINYNGSLYSDTNIIEIPLVDGTISRDFIFYLNIEPYTDTCIGNDEIDLSKYNINIVYDLNKSIDQLLGEQADEVIEDYVNYSVGNIQRGTYGAYKHFNELLLDEIIPYLFSDLGGIKFEKSENNLDPKYWYYNLDALPIKYRLNSKIDLENINLDSELWSGVEPPKNVFGLRPERIVSLRTNNNKDLATSTDIINTNNRNYYVDWYFSNKYADLKIDKNDKINRRVILLRSGLYCSEDISTGVAENPEDISFYVMGINIPEDKYKIKFKTNIIELIDTFNLFFKVKFPPYTLLNICKCTGHNKEKSSNNTHPNSILQATYFLNCFGIYESLYNKEFNEFTMKHNPIYGLYYKGLMGDSRSENVDKNIYFKKNITVGKEFQIEFKNSNTTNPLLIDFAKIKLDKDNDPYPKYISGVQIGKSLSDDLEIFDTPQIYLGLEIDKTELNFNSETLKFNKKIKTIYVEGEKFYINKNKLILFQTQLEPSEYKEYQNFFNDHFNNFTYNEVELNNSTYKFDDDGIDFTSWKILSFYAADTSTYIFSNKDGFYFPSNYTTESTIRDICNLNNFTTNQKLSGNQYKRISILFKGHINIKYSGRCHIINPVVYDPHLFVYDLSSNIYNEDFNAPYLEVLSNNLYCADFSAPEMNITDLKNLINSKTQYNITISNNKQLITNNYYPLPFYELTI